MARRNMLTPEGAKDKKGTLKRMLILFSRYKIGIVIVLILGVLISVAQVVSPFLLGNITDMLISSLKNGINMQTVVRAVLVLLISYGASILLGYIQQLLLVNISQKFIYDLRKKVQLKFKHLPLSYFDKRATGDILSIVTNDVDTVVSGLESSLPNLFSSFLTLVLVFGGMLVISPRLTLIALITLPLSALLSVLIMKFGQKYFRGQQEGLGELGGYIEEMYTGHEVVRAYNNEEVVIGEFEGLNEKLYNNAKKAQFISGIVFPISNFFSNLAYVAIAIYGGILIVTGPTGLSVGNLQTFIQLLKQFTNPIAQLSSMINEIQATIAAAERVFDFLDAKQEPDDPEPSQLIVNPQGSVFMNNVEFGYDPENILIKNLNLKVSFGDRIAIVGPTGAGKTTIVNLILRFYDISRGEILIDGINITDMRRDDLRELFGIVLQDTWLFSGSIMENIRYGRMDASDQEVVEAAKNAYVHEFVRTLPDGYSTIIQEDAGNLSNGQRQLITIARALLSNPRILILDEATSSVDTRTELMIQKAMENLMKDRTSFVIAHRLSTIRDSKTILVVENGDIVESGSHKELLAQNGAYSRLYKSQIVGSEQE